MGTMIQRKGLTEGDFRGDRFIDRDKDLNLQGNNEVLNLTQANIIKEIHSSFLDVGADLLLIETIFDTLNAKAAVYAIKQYCGKKMLIFL